MIKAGSTVKHQPTGEEWFVLGVNITKDQVCMAGWPPSIARLSDCTLIKIGNGLTDEETEYRNNKFGYGWD